MTLRFSSDRFDQTKIVGTASYPTMGRSGSSRFTWRSWTPANLCRAQTNVRNRPRYHRVAAVTYTHVRVAAAVAGAKKRCIVAKGPLFGLRPPIAGNSQADYID